MLEDIISFKKYRSHCVKIANDFHYPKEIVLRIIKCEQEGDLVRVMMEARKKFL